MFVRFVACLIAPMLISTGAFGAASNELTGNPWRLVKIMSMDDTIDTPKDRSKYTLELKEDGTATFSADCNRATGSWTSESASRLLFGPVAATRAMCPPGSLSEKYLAQFKWVRSYVMKDGHLFLATMADGSIVEFEPVGNAPLAATVLGENVYTADGQEMQQIILSRLFDRYAADHDIKAEAGEIDAFVENMRRGMAERGLTAEKDLTPVEAAEAEKMRRGMGRTMIRQWKINNALFGQYGGRIIYQQLGPEPLDAYRRFLEQRQREGAFTIHDQALADGFWRYFTDESKHDFMKPGSADEAKAFAVPPWDRKS